MIKKLSIFIILLLAIPYAAIANQFWYAGGGGGGGSGQIADGTIEGQVPYWDNTGGTWTPATGLTWNNVTGQMLFQTSALATPAIAFGGDTGIDELAPDALSVIAGGVAGITVTELAGAITTDLFGTVNAGPIKLNSTWISNDGGAAEGISIDDAGSVTLSGGLTVSAAHFDNTTVVNAATYDLLPGDFIVHVTYTTTAAVTSLTIPTAQILTGRNIVIKDAGGLAGTNSITVDTETGELIDGAATFVLGTNWQSVGIYCYSGNCFTK